MTVASPARKYRERRTLLSLAEEKEVEFFFPDGLLGFSTHRYFTLNRYRPADGSPSPFCVLESKGRELSFPLVSPEILIPDYRLAIPELILQKLAAPSAGDLIIQVIVTLRDHLEDITVNLQGPLLLNVEAGRGLQMIVEHYPLQFPLLRHTA